MCFGRSLGFLRAERKVFQVESEKGGIARKGPGLTDRDEVVGVISWWNRLAPLGVIRKEKAGWGRITWRLALDFPLK